MTSVRIAFAITICVCAATFVGLLARGEPMLAEEAPIRLENVAASSGIDFVLENSPTENKHLIETMAGGVAAFDYDSDGRTDIFFTNGASVPSLSKGGKRHWNRLYRNLGGWRFADVTAQAGLAGSGYSMGAAAGDFDNDGRVDLLVSGVGTVNLYRNRGGTFEDVTKRAGIQPELWSVGAAWLDYDNDGLLDLFVLNYVRWTPRFDVYCGNPSRGVRSYCHPRHFEGLPNRLYHNEGNGRFRDVSEESGIAGHVGKGMAVATADYDGDGFMDLFVTNDKVPNFLFRNLGNGRFREVAFDAGVALPDNGVAVSNMGVDFQDFDNDELPDLLMTALAGETFPLFRNVGRGQFADAGHVSRLGPLSLRYSGWGLGLVDLDNDGWKDVFTANSHVDDRVREFEAAEYRLHNAVFRSQRDGTFADVSRFAGAEFLVARAHRGCAFADFDRDGRVDVVVSSLGEPAELWRNVTGGSGNYLALKLEGVRSNRDGMGAEVRLDGQWNRMSTAVGYASSSHDGVHFGIGSRSRVAQLEIRWPSGRRQVLRDVAANQLLRVLEAE